MPAYDYDATRGERGFRKTKNWISFVCIIFGNYWNTLTDSSGQFASRLETGRRQPCILPGAPKPAYQLSHFFEPTIFSWFFDFSDVGRFCSLPLPGRAGRERKFPAPGAVRISNSLNGETALDSDSFHFPYSRLGVFVFLFFFGRGGLRSLGLKPFSLRRRRWQLLVCQSTIRKSKINEKRENESECECEFRHKNEDWVLRTEDRRPRTNKDEGKKSRMHLAKIWSCPRACLRLLDPEFRILFSRSTSFFLRPAVD